MYCVEHEFNRVCMFVCVRALSFIQTGVFVVDFGENLSGRCRITVKNTAGHANEAIVMQ